MNLSHINPPRIDELEDWNYRVARQLREFHEDCSVGAAALRIAIVL